MEFDSSNLSPVTPTAVQADLQQLEVERAPGGGDEGVLEGTTIGDVTGDYENDDSDSSEV
jgi:hypothetical protein